MSHIKHFNKTFVLADEHATILFGQELASLIKQKALFQPGLVIYLQGDLGMGKTCFSRAFIQTFIPGQRVKSPTYTLIEHYQADSLSLYHLDLYRLAEPEELAYLGLRDVLTDDYILLIEWPKKAQGFLPPADITITIEPFGMARKVTVSGLVVETFNFTRQGEV
jgi:tRNA threonylcarbamoyladenosine biosynthesis protein TsaE